jgi:WD40 repeat protein
VVNSAEFSRNGAFIATACAYGFSSLWDADRGVAKYLAIPQRDGAVTSAVFSPDSRAVATAATGGKSGVWDTQTGNFIGRFPEGAIRSASFNFNANGKFVLAAGGDSVRIWKLAIDREEWQYPPEPGR